MEWLLRPPSPVDRYRDIEKLEDQSLQLGELGFEDLDDRTVGGDQVLVSRPAEDAGQARCAWGRVPASFGVERELLETTGRHGWADLAFDEGWDQRGDEVVCQQSFDACGVMKEHRSNRLRNLQHVVPAFEVGLVLVDSEYLNRAEIVVAGDERPAVVRVGVGSHDVVANAEADAAPGGLDGPVADVGSWPAAGLLAVAHRRGLFDAARDPACRPCRLECPCHRLLYSDDGLHAGLG